MQSKKEQILQLVKQYYDEYHRREPFIPGVSKVNYGGRFYDAQDIMNLVDSSLDFWLTAGPWTNRFERKMADFLKIKYVHLTNSGSSANLLAFNALTSLLLADRRIKKGDEVITVACGFPTTITPVVQFGAIPVFVDIELPSYNIDVTLLEGALSCKTKAVFIAHTLGNPFDLQYVKEFCEKHQLWLIEDNCDSLGSKYLLEGEWKYTGTIGDIGTSSFYPPHHITMGEGGAVYTNNPLLSKIILSFRDWGRDCWCKGGVDNTCGKRFSHKYGELPQGYDHKYVYSHLGYNLKVTDMQAAIGCSQLDKLELIIDARRKNHNRLYDSLKNFDRFFVLPEGQRYSIPSWFGFILTVREGAGFTRDELTSFLESKRIQTRTLFSGNILRHPAFSEMVETGTGYRVFGTLDVTDQVMRDTFWLGVYPGLTDEMIDYMIDAITDFVNSVINQSSLPTY